MDKLKVSMKIKEKEISTNNFIFPALFIFFAIIFEMANFLYLGFRNTEGSLMVFPSYFLFDFAIILMLAGLIYVVHNKIAMQILYYLLLFIQCALNIANSTMYNIFGDILSFDLFYLGGEATSAITADVIDWGGVFLNFAIYVVIVVTGVILVKKNKKTVTIKNFSMPVIVLATTVLCWSMGLGLFGLQEHTLADTEPGQSEIESSDKYLWNNFQFKLDAFEKFGNYGFYTKSVLNLIFHNEADNNEKDFYQNFIDEGYQAENPDAPLYGDNLIVILCESMDWYAIDPFNTPTLYSIASGNNSISFTGFHARNRTNNSEGIVLNGSTPRNISITEALENGYNFDYALPKLFKATSSDEETVTTYVHQNTGDFYNRDVTHISGLGFDYMYMLEDYTGEQEQKGWGKWFTDLDFSSNLMDYIIPDTDRFLTFFATISTHGPYTYRNPYYEEYYQIYDENFEEYSVWVEENTPFTIPTDESDYKHFYYYKAAFIDLDHTVANIISELEERGRASDTSILLFADHNAYYHDLSLKVKGIEKSDFQETFAYNIPLMLYSPKLTQGEGEIIDTFCNTYDVLPTICDVYGLPSNTNLLYGFSIFSEEIKNSFFASHLNGMFTEDIYSLNITDIYIVGDNVTDQDIENFNENANRFFKRQEELEIIYENGINGTIKLGSQYV